MMLLKQQTHITLKQQIKKINCLSTAYDNTFVLSIVVRPAKSEAIIHLNSSGDILYRRDYSCEIGSFGMLRDKQIIVLNVREATIEIINLQTQQIHRVNHNFILDDADQMQIYTFSDTKFFCVVEQEGNSPGQRFKMTYYNYNKILIDQNPISVNEQTIGDDGLDRIVQANNHSKMAWLYPAQQDLIQFHTWDLKDDYNGRYNCISMRNTLSDIYHMDEELEINIENLWESKEDIYTLVCNSNHTQEQQQNQDNEQAPAAVRIINNIFIVDVKQGTIRESNYLFRNEDTRQYVSNSVSDSFYLGTYSAFHTRHFRQSETAPIFYVSHENQAIISMDKWTPSSYCNFYISGADSSSLILAQYDNGDIKEIHVTVKRLSEMKEIALHFMLHVNEDFDDDLLQDALDLMDLIS